MRIHAYLLLCLALVCGGAFGRSGDAIDTKMLDDCRVLAKELNTSKKLGISLEGIVPLFTWHASCAERLPTGPGNVTALCEGTRATAKGETRVFFWQKSAQGKLNKGYFDCVD